jgi:hypothetical protein
VKSPTVEFLTYMYPEGPWLLTAIPVERKSGLHTDSHTFYPKDAKRIDKWLKDLDDGTYNFYFSVNPPNRDMDKKATRLDIKELAFLHVDLDPRAGEDPEAERGRILDLLTTGLPKDMPKPSCITDSGGGYWAFWRLKDPFAINANEKRYDEAKLYNLQLELLFGADHCHNVDRIARLPGTTNYPDQRKVSKGRKVAPSVVVYTTDEEYPLTRFIKAPSVAAKSDIASADRGQSIVISGNLPRIQNVMEELSKATDLCKVAVVQGCDPDDPTRWAKDGGGVDRSSALHYVCCELVRAEYSDDIIYSVITDPDFAISDSVIDGSNGRTDGYAKRQIQRARELVKISPGFMNLNDQFAAVLSYDGVGQRVVNLVTGESHKPNEFISFYANQFVTTFNDKGDPRQMPLGKYWWEHKDRRSYARDKFAPPGVSVGKDELNTWQGFGIEPLPGGSCDLYLAHVREVIAGGDQSIYEYLVNWMAKSVQEPSRKIGTALVLRGAPGSGKGTFAKPFTELFGDHGMTITDPSLLTGSFNGHLEHCVTLFADEAVGASMDKKGESIIKALVTEETIAINAKFKAAGQRASYLRIIMASNEDLAVRISKGDRRFVVLDVKNDRIQDRKYFEAIAEELDNGGREALLYHLLGRDVSEFHPESSRPKTLALSEQKNMSGNGLERWWVSILQEGVLDDVVLTAGAHIQTGTVCWDYNSAASPRIRIGDMTQFLQRVLGANTKRQTDANGLQYVQGRNVHPSNGQEKTVHSARPYVFTFPPLEEMRRAYDIYNGSDTEWEDEPIAPQTEQEAF